MSDASSATPPPIVDLVDLVDLVDDGMTDEEIAAHTQMWLAELQKAPVVDLGISAAEVPDQLYAAGEL